MTIETTDLRLDAGPVRILTGISLALEPGTLTALVGPNGAGKSTLLSVIAGDYAPTAGTATIEGHSVQGWASKDLARKRAVLMQDHRVRFAFSVREVVEMGRTPHLSDAETDERIVDEAMTTADVTHLAARDVQSLSGGEAARAAFARVLAQDCPIVLLDEPTAALDLKHQESLLSTARQLADDGACVVVVLHDLNLAAGYSDRVVMLKNGSIVADGPPSEVFTPSTIEDVYDQRVHVLVHPSRGTPLVVTA